jgi:hypothetical protein
MTRLVVAGQELVLIKPTPDASIAVVRSWIAANTPDRLMPDWLTSPRAVRSSVSEPMTLGAT